MVDEVKDPLEGGETPEAPEETPEEKPEAKEEETLKEEEEEEFEPPIRPGTESSKEESKEESRFGFAIRSMEKRIMGKINKALGSGEGEDHSGEGETPDQSGEIDKKGSALLDEMDKRERKAEIRDFLSENPEYKKYRGKIEKTAFHQNFAGVSVNFIAKGLSAPDAEMIGADKSKKADKEALESKTGGTQQKPSKSSGTDWRNASKKDFENKKVEVLSRERSG